MIFEYILAALAYLAAAWTPREPLLPPGLPWAPGAAVASVLLSLLLSSWTARSVERRMRSSREDWARLVNFFGRVTVLLRLAVLALFAAAVHPGGWGLWAARLPAPASWPGVLEAVILLPFLVSWGGCALALSRVEGGEGGAAAFAAFRLRGAAVILGTLAAGGATADLLFASGDLAALLDRFPWLRAIVVAAAFLASLALLPFFLRAVWPTRPLPEGDLKTALLDFGAREGVRVREIRLWETGGASILNAAVAGLLPATRTVFLTRALLEYLKPEEVLAVFAHEAGHIRGRHALGSLALAAGWAGFLFAADGGVLDPGPGAARWILQAGLTAAFVLLFLAYSRRAERAADFYAAKALGNLDLVRETLGRVAMLNGDTRSLRSLTHSSIGARIESLTRLSTLPAEADRFRRAFAALAGLIAVLAVLGLAAAAPRILS